MKNFDYSYKLSANQGSPLKAQNKYIIIHDTGNDNNKGAHSGRNEASYMKSHWDDAYTHAIVDDEKTYIVGEPGYIAYGAGEVANSRSPFQVELAHVDSQARFRKEYKRYLEVIKYFANKYHIPLTLDTGVMESGIKSHAWVSKNIWGDHQDPWGYLEKWGVSKAQFAKDLGIKNSTPNPAKEEKYYQYANQVVALTKINRYRDKSFLLKVDSYPKGTVFDIWKTVKFGTITRFRLANGLYITSNVKYVKRVY